MSRFIKYSLLSIILLISVGCACQNKKMDLTEISIDFLDNNDVLFQYFPDGSIVLTIEENDLFDLSIDTTPNNASKKHIVCYSNDTGIIEISDYTIKTIKAGTTSVYCEDTNLLIKSNTIEVRVN